MKVSQAEATARNQYEVFSWNLEIIQRARSEYDSGYSQYKPNSPVICYIILAGELIFIMSRIDFSCNRTILQMNKLSHINSDLQARHQAVTRPVIFINLFINHSYGLCSNRAVLLAAGTRVQAALKPLYDKVNCAKNSAF